MDAEEHGLFKTYPKHNEIGASKFCFSMVSNIYRSIHLKEPFCINIVLFMFGRG